MFLARVVGHATSTVRHPSLRGRTLLLCQPVDDEGAAWGEPSLAVAEHGAGIGATVMVSADGLHARHLVRDERAPLRNAIIGVIDD